MIHKGLPAINKLDLKDLIKILAIAFFFGLLLNVESAQAQGRSNIIQLSGLVLGEDSTAALSGANIYVPSAGRGTSTNIYGYFSLPVLAGDSVVISSIGYKRQYFSVPEDQKESMTIVVELQTDTTFLPAVEVFPFPTAEMFKEAVLALQLPDQQQYDNMGENLNADLLARMMEAMPMDGSMNHRWFMDQQFNRIQYSAGPRPNPLLNPFAWGEFIRSIKRGDFKRKR
jgi:hypothetical protein